QVIFVSTPLIFQDTSVKNDPWAAHSHLFNLNSLDKDSSSQAKPKVPMGSVPMGEMGKSTVSQTGMGKPMGTPTIAQPTLAQPTPVLQPTSINPYGGSTGF